MEVRKTEVRGKGKLCPDTDMWLAVVEQCALCNFDTVVLTCRADLQSLPFASVFLMKSCRVAGSPNSWELSPTEEGGLGAEEEDEVSWLAARIDGVDDVVVVDLLRFRVFVVVDDDDEEDVVGVCVDEDVW